jgi:hypothetical protein
MTRKRLLHIFVACAIWAAASIDAVAQRGSQPTVVSPEIGADPPQGARASRQKRLSPFAVHTGAASARVM